MIFEPNYGEYGEIERWKNANSSEKGKTHQISYNGRRNTSRENGELKEKDFNKPNTSRNSVREVSF